MASLTTTDGTAVAAGALDPDEVNRQFSAAMNDDGPDDQAPPRRQPKPAGEDAPKPRRGRPPKSEQSRTADKAAVAAPPPPSPAVTAKRAGAAEETFRLTGTCLLLVGKATRMPAFTADGFMVNANAAQLAVALADVAAVEPQIARWLDKAPSTKVTAWMGLASVAAGLGLQAAANHGLIKPGSMNTSDPADIIRVNEEALAAHQAATENEAAEMARLDDQADQAYQAEHQEAAA